MFYNKKAKQLEAQLKAKDKVIQAQAELIEKERQKAYTFEGMMSEALGMEIDFSSADKDKCLPPHYLEGLTDEERKNFIFDMELIYSNEKFQKVVKYMINVFSLGMVYKKEERDRQNCQAAVVGFRTFLNKFDDIHREFLESKKNPDDEEFDDQEILPR